MSENKLIQQVYTDFVNSAAEFKHLGSAKKKKQFLRQFSWTSYHYFNHLLMTGMTHRQKWTFKQLLSYQEWIRHNDLDHYKKRSESYIKQLSELTQQVILQNDFAFTHMLFFYLQWSTLMNDFYSQEPNDEFKKLTVKAWYQLSNLIYSGIFDNYAKFTNMYFNIYHGLQEP